MKIGVEVSIDVTKIDKARLFQGQKGKYLTMTTFIDIDNKDQYDNNGFIAHKKNQDEQGNTPILGNVKVFWSDGGGTQPVSQQQAPPQQQQGQQQQYQEQGRDNQGFKQQAPQVGFQQAQQQHAQNQAPKVSPQEPAIDFDDDLPF